MIFPRNDIAWVRLADAHLEPFDEERLADSIRVAARVTGRDDWWLAESIAAALHDYARECASNRVIAAGDIAQYVADVLATLGYADIGQAYARRWSHSEINLDKLAGGVFELDFYRRLDAALREAATGQTTSLHVRGLRTCVMQLRGAQRWGGGCRALAEDIVGYVRARVTNGRANCAAALKVAVLE